MGRQGMGEVSFVMAAFMPLLIMRKDSFDKL